MRHPHLKITRVLAFACPNNLLALQSVAHAATRKFNPKGWATRPAGLGRTSFDLVVTGEMETELLAVGGKFPIAVTKIALGRAILGGMEGDGDRVAGLQAGFLPTGARQPHRMVQFDRPVPHFARVVLGVEMQEAMRISPVQTGYGALERGGFLQIVSRRPVMGEYRPGSDRKKQHYGATR